MNIYGIGKKDQISIIMKNFPQRKAHVQKVALVNSTKK